MKRSLLATLAAITFASSLSVSAEAATLKEGDQVNLVGYFFPQVQYGGHVFWPSESWPLRSAWIESKLSDTYKNVAKPADNAYWAYGRFSTKSNAGMSRFDQEKIYNYNLPNDPELLTGTEDEEYILIPTSNFFKQLETKKEFLDWVKNSTPGRSPFSAYFYHYAGTCLGNDAKHSCSTSEGSSTKVRITGTYVSVKNDKANLKIILIDDMDRVSDNEPVSKNPTVQPVKKTNAPASGFSVITEKQKKSLLKQLEKLTSEQLYAFAEKTNRLLQNKNLSNTRRKTLEDVKRLLYIVEPSDGTGSRQQLDEIFFAGDDTGKIKIQPLKK